MKAYTQSVYLEIMSARMSWPIALRLMVVTSRSCDLWCDHLALSHPDKAGNLPMLSLGLMILLAMWAIVPSMEQV